MRHLFSLSTVLFYSVFIIIISTIPITGPVQFSFFFFDKAVHFFMYGIFSFVTVNCFSLKGLRYPRFYGFLYVLCFGLAMELMQAYLPYRSFEGGDIVFNIMGSALGCLARVV